MKKIKYYLHLFFLAAITGWVIEILYSLIFRNKLVTPGNISPFCPIYGVALVFMMILVRKNENKIYSFIKIFSIATLVEYISAYISEVYFDHRIWNYSNYVLNIDGRVCLIFSLIWGIFGFLYIYIVEPKMYKFYEKYSSKKSDLFLYTMIILFFLNILIKVLFKYNIL